MHMNTIKLWAIRACVVFGVLWMGISFAPASDEAVFGQAIFGQSVFGSLDLVALPVHALTIHGVVSLILMMAIALAVVQTKKKTFN